MKWFINTVPTVLNENSLVCTTLDLMLKKKEPYCLTVNSKNMITGILTSMDFLSTKENQADLTLINIVHSPLVFAHLSNIEVDVNRIIEQHDLHYIPIFRSKLDFSRGNLVGVLDLTEMIKANLLNQK